MEKLTRSQTLKNFFRRTAADRSLEEQLADVRADGGHGRYAMLRAGALAAQGIIGPKPAASTCLVFGCYRPFTTPQLLGHAVRLLEFLGVDFTWLENESCCGLPMICQAEGEQRGAMVEAAGGFAGLNRERAQAKGARRLVFCCAGCAQVARGVAGEDAEDGNLYLLDVLLEAVAGRPMQGWGAVGYFEGCHSSYKMQFPAVELGWKRYHSFLGAVPGLEVKDITGQCCKHSPEKVIERALELGLDTVVCPCSGCIAGLRAVSVATGGKVALASYPELLLRLLGEVA